MITLLDKESEELMDANGKKRKRVNERIANNPELTEKIVQEIKEGERGFKTLAEKYSVSINYVRSAFAIYQHDIEKHGGKERFDNNGFRIHDGGLYPVISFNIHDLSNEELERTGLSKYLKKRC